MEKITQNLNALASNNTRSRKFSRKLFTDQKNLRENIYKIISRKNFTDAHFLVRKIKNTQNNLLREFLKIPATSKKFLDN